MKPTLHENFNFVGRGNKFSDFEIFKTNFKRVSINLKGYKKSYNYNNILLPTESRNPPASTSKPIKTPSKTHSPPINDIRDSTFQNATPATTAPRGNRFRP